MPSPPTAAAVRAALRAHADPARVHGAARYFKTGPGEYGEGDVFIGVTVPAQRAVARRFRGLPLGATEALLTSPVHEERLTALLILVDQFGRADTARRRQIFTLYKRRLRFVNNWDLVDTSAPAIVGGWLADPASRSMPPHALLTRLARSRHLWSRRIAMLTTLHDITRGNPREAIRIATILVNDPHDLIQKAVGWMLREVGKRASADALDRFLARHAATMPRTTLRYAVERLPARDRQRWLAARVRPTTRAARSASAAPDHIQARRPATS